MKPAKKVLLDLDASSNVSVRSNEELLGKVQSAIAADDKARKKKEAEPLRRKPVLSGIPGNELDRRVRVSMWDVLHTLGRATTLSWKGAGRGLAEHWGALKYSQALTGGPDSFLGLSTEGRKIAERYKTLQSHELGMAFGLTLAKQVLGRRFPSTP
ncbi:hypothetical protein NEH16_06975 [Streptomyces drozdowiczii]|uniref:Uncharacterized protein n=1 Tax=Streptomyces drozdowiczii TaxID=202862 RepID=A0ABY6PP03_9ACTN|nr:hypothetical protein [Streptomyces drozdowiczii]UZK53932.1 hypothetical protein NEH16_06975 [Streptomyces drozdowiczii]